MRLSVELILTKPVQIIPWKEELEEIRKREERKDRLHQNYLKRKASGAQKRYEDKIKKRKKAEIEAKKAAIRAEDIAKGVFVPVSSLPQREPMKGVQTAWISPYYSNERIENVVKQYVSVVRPGVVLVENKNVGLMELYL